MLAQCSTLFLPQIPLTQVHEAHPILRHRRALLDSNLTDPSV